MIEMVTDWGPAVVWAGVLFFLSEGDSSGFTIPLGADKVVHGALYLVLGLTLSWAGYRGGSAIPMSVLILVGIGYGALDEWHQSFVPGRDPSVGDAVADAIGVLAGFAIFRRRALSSRGGGVRPQTTQRRVD